MRNPGSIRKCQFWKPIMDSWVKAFSEDLPALEGKVGRTFRRAFERFVKEVEDDDHLPLAFFRSFKHTTQQLEAHEKTLESDLESDIAQFRKRIRELRSLDEDVLKEIMTPIFLRANCERGKSFPPLFSPSFFS